MFFVFHILVFAYLTPTEINCYSQGTTTEGKNYVTKQQAIFNSRAAAHFNGTTQNTNKLNTDLKSNVFNKILSDEMLSVKDNKDPKDSTDKPFFKISSKAHSVTKTLEVKQKWPMFENINSNKDEVTKISLPAKDEDLKTLMQIIMKNSDGTPKHDQLSKTKFQKPTLTHRNLVINKVVEMRSLPDSPMEVALKDRSVPGVRMCTCMKTNPSAVCSHSCTGSSTASHKKRCTHSTPSARSHICSRVSTTNHSCANTPPSFVSTPNPYSFYPAFYLPYTYFGSDISYRVTYPQPNIFDDVKHRKPKHRKTTTPRYDDDLYYDSNDSREKNSYNDNSAEDYNEMKSVSKKLENYHKAKKGSTLLINIDYIDDTDSKNDDKDADKMVMINKEGVKYDVNQDKLVKELVNDLKGKRKKVIIKDCYCNSSTKDYQINIFVQLFTLLFCCIKL